MQEKNKTKTKSETISKLPTNKANAGTSTALTNNQSVSKKTSVENFGGRANVSATTHGTNMKNNGIANAISTTVAITANSLGVSASVTAATTNATVPGDAANVESPKKRKVKKQATTTASPTCCNPEAREISG
jgi:hypothetical protein